MHLKLSRLTPNRSDKLCPASARREAEFIHKPASPFVTVRATLLLSPVPPSVFPLKFAPS